MHLRTSTWCVKGVYYVFGGGGGLILSCGEFGGIFLGGFVCVCVMIVYLGGEVQI